MRGGRCKASDVGWGIGRLELTKFTFNFSSREALSVPINIEGVWQAAWSDLSGYFHLQVSFTSQGFFLERGQEGTAKHEEKGAFCKATRLEKRYFCLNLSCLTKPNGLKWYIVLWRFPVLIYSVDTGNMIKKPVKDALFCKQCNNKVPLRI